MTRRITRTFPAHRVETLSCAVRDIADSRVAHLEALAFRTPIGELLASAYMQGIVDAYQAMTGEKAERKLPI